MPIDLAEPAIIFTASSKSWAFKSFIFWFAMSSNCFFEIDATIFLPGSFEPPLSLTASFFIKEAVKLKGGSKEPGRNIVATISKKQLEDIANQKMADLNAHDLDEAVKIIAGSARSMGIEVKE